MTFLRAVASALAPYPVPITPTDHTGDKDRIDVARPNWEYIRVDVLLPEHPKLDGLSPADKWLLVEIWCYCGRQRTDGVISADKWKTFGSPAQRRRLADRGLVDELPFGAVVAHDYTAHNRSRQEIDELSVKRAEAGRKGGRGGSKGQASA